MIRARLLFALSLAGYLALAGCERNHYEIELTPKNGSIERKITTWRTGGGEDPTTGEKAEAGDFPEEELKQIASAYDSPVPEKRDVKHRFSGIFAGEMPDDVGGEGRYLHWESSLGSTSGYIERCRGNDDLLSNVEARFQAADRLVDLAIGWLETEVKDEPGFPELRKFLDGQFRRDLKNLSLYAWSNAITTDYQPDQAFSEIAARAGQYLAERDYFSWEQLPELSRAYQEADEGQPRRLVEMVQKSLAAKIGGTKEESPPKCLEFLSSPFRTGRSMEAYLRNTEDFKAMMNDWRENKENDPNRKPPEPIDVIRELAGTSFELSALSLTYTGDALAVKLAVPDWPIATNGEWDEHAKRIQWNKAVLSKEAKAQGYPTLLYALWSEPDAEAQTRLFGKVLLEGESLARYGLWHQGLSIPEAKQWEDFLGTLKPNQDLKARLRRFQFAGDKRTDPAAKGRDLLLGVLDKEGE